MNLLLKFLKVYGLRKDHFEQYLPECCSIPFGIYVSKVNIIEQTSEQTSRFNHLQFGISPDQLTRIMGKPSYTKIDQNSIIYLYKRKVSGFKFVLTACFLDQQLVYFQSECRESLKGVQQELLSTVTSKYSCEPNELHFNDSCALLVSDLFTLKVNAYSTNRSHVIAMREFGREFSPENVIQEMFSLKRSQLNQFI